jgi:hypothetical protein
VNAAACERNRKWQFSGLTSPFDHTGDAHANEAYRVREHLTEAEVTKLLGTLKCNRTVTAWLIGLLTVLRPFVSSQNT